MVTIPTLILPILLSTALVWIASALIWMVLPWHKKDFASLPDEASARVALKPQNLDPGQYNFPHIAHEDMKKPEVQALFEEGPTFFMTVLPKGVPAMGKAIALSAVFYLVVSLTVAYLASRTLTAGAPYMDVFQITSTVAWLAYGAATVPEAIWFGRPWSSVVKGFWDAFIFALLTAGAFSALWPDAA